MKTTVIELNQHVSFSVPGTNLSGSGVVAGFHNTPDEDPVVLLDKDLGELDSHFNGWKALVVARRYIHTEPMVIDGMGNLVPARFA